MEDFPIHAITFIFGLLHPLLLGINPSAVILHQPTIDCILIEESSKGAPLSQGEDECQCLPNKPVWMRKGLMGSLSLWGELQRGEDDLNGASIENKAYEAHSPGDVSCTLCLIVGDARVIGRGGWEQEKRNTRVRGGHPGFSPSHPRRDRGHEWDWLRRRSFDSCVW